jgi:UV DNA damage endonuclease
MAPKRKKADATVTDPQPEPKVRRSSRRVTRGASQQQDDFRQENLSEEVMGAVVSPTISQAAFERTMRELGEMGMKLQSAVKVQRLAVETSDLSKCDTEKVREEAFKLRPTVRRQPKTGREKKTETEGVGGLNVDAGLDADAEAGGDAFEEKADAEVVERSARRAPPVNSDVLPLPWKGRLGYVSIDLHKPLFSYWDDLWLRTSSFTIAGARSKADAWSYRLVSTRTSERPILPSFRLGLAVLHR